MCHYFKEKLMEGFYLKKFEIIMNLKHFVLELINLLFYLVIINFF